ncbi:MAG: alanine racemase, partial [Clostridia bacterium]|nr:alanine racemase [Clostridia bacterium]
MQKTLSKISLPALRRNSLKIKKLAKHSKFYAVVKADGYGHGAEEVSRAIEDICDGFCVAIAEEGAALRTAGISKEILVLTPPLDRCDAERIKAYNLTATVNSVETAELISGLDCHIKVNTGMNRNGCNTDGLAKILHA